MNFHLLSAVAFHLLIRRLHPRTSSSHRVVLFFVVKNFWHARTEQQQVASKVEQVATFDGFLAAFFVKMSRVKRWMGKSSAEGNNKTAIKLQLHVPNSSNQLLSREH